MKLPYYSGGYSGIGLLDAFFKTRNAEKMATQLLEGLMSAGVHHLKENSTKNTMKKSEMFALIDKH